MTCTGVSFAHGSNDGQKGMGLIMLILIGIIPATYALNLDASEKSVAELELAARSDLYLVSGSLNKLNKQGKFNSSEERAAAVGFLSKLRPSTEFIPVWVRIAVAFALGCGTMIGWKRIVITVGEKPSIWVSSPPMAARNTAEPLQFGTPPALFRSFDPSFRLCYSLKSFGDAIGSVQMLRPLVPESASPILGLMIIVNRHHADVNGLPGGSSIAVNYAWLRTKL